MSDIVIVGSGISSLVAAAKLAKAGRSVTLFERNATLGGFIDSGELTVPGFVHDTYSSWHPLFVSGAGYAELGDELHAAGLEYANTDGALTASVYRDGNDHHSVIAHRDPGVTAAGLTSRADRGAYLAMLDELQQRSGVIFGALGSDLTSKRALAKLGAQAWRTLGVAGMVELARDAASSGRAFVERRFETREVDALWTPWLLHSGLGPDSATGGVMLPVFAASMHGFGLPVVVGGARHFVDAFESVLRSYGVQIRTGEDVEEILVRGGRVTGVRTAAGVTEARHVLANATPLALSRDLVPDAPQLDAYRRRAAAYRPGRGAMQIHLALDAPVPWLDERLREVPLFHLSSGSASTGIAVAQAAAGTLPAEPTVVVGQQSLLDPSRAPQGKATLWLQLQEVPLHPRADALGELDVTGGWSNPALREGYLARVVDRVETFAPGIGALVLGSAVIAPTDLESYNRNAIGGDPYAGSAEIDQNLFWRPFPGAAGWRPGPRGLWQIGASTHPGPGLSGGSGHLVADRILGSKN